MSAQLEADAMQAIGGEVEAEDPYDIKRYLVSVLPASAYDRPKSLALPDDKLGVKVSFITRNWRKRERELHAKSLNGMKSPLKQEIIAHEYAFLRANKILGCGKNNKEKALRLRLEKVERENALIAKRLEAVQNSHTDIAACNAPNKELRARVARRRKNLLHARDLAKKRIDYENSLLLDRLQRTGPSIVDTKTLLKEYHHNNRVKRTMCKLEVGYDIAKRMQQQADKRKQLPSLQSKPVVRLPATSSSAPTLAKVSVPITPTTAKENTFTPISPPKQCDKTENLQDRGQVFQERVWIRCVTDAKSSDVHKEAVTLLAFNLKERRMVRFEVERLGSGMLREVEVPYEHLKQAFEEAARRAIEKGAVEQARINLATSAANKLVLFGEESELVWSN